MQSTTLYRLFNKKGALLYVGITANPGRRFNQHAISQEWWDEVATCSFEHFGNRQEALAAECKAISREHPERNLIGVAFDIQNERNIRSAKLEKQLQDRVKDFLRFMRKDQHVPLKTIAKEIGVSQAKAKDLESYIYEPVTDELWQRYCYFFNIDPEKTLASLRLKGFTSRYSRRLPDGVQLPTKGTK